MVHKCVPLPHPNQASFPPIGPFLGRTKGKGWGVQYPRDSPEPF
ncbi:hypothetical protein pp309_000058 [Proteus phage 309]|uniref:Uncharacterized protein n=1 Tax=Proteus phage 309 TaxID=2894355 RepID=A0AAE8YHU8_9CAUD|nr:hypothetical protein pp309_000058 [Proteus phage 309]